MTQSQFRMSFALAALFAAMLSGCQSSSQRQWEIVAENQSNTPCSIVVEMGSGNNHSNARIDDLAKGKRLTLVVGDFETVVHSVKVIRGGKEEMTNQPELKLPIGKRYVLVVEAEGVLTSTLWDR